MVNAIFINKKKRAYVFWTLLVLLPLLWTTQTLAADRLYFVSIAEKINVQPQILLEWGAMEGEIPTSITEFRLYRSVNGGAHTGVKTFFGESGQIPHALVSAKLLKNIVLSDPDGARIEALLERLELIRQGEYPELDPVTSSNFAPFLHELLDPLSNIYDPMRRMLLIRAFPAVAQACGFAFVDRDVANGSTYQYMLTAISGGTESLPIGQSEAIDPAGETVLPAPADFRQIRVSGCSELRKNLDDNRIHFSWEVPTDPNLLGLKIMTYGYDIFWSATPVSSPDFRNTIPAGAYKLNDLPILASGPPPTEGPDSFLARDDGTGHSEGPPWQRGQEYYYYLVARDLAGHYSGTALIRDPVTGSEIPARVVDTTPPKAPWNLHTEEINSKKTAVTTAPTIPQLALVWDQVNPINYVRFFGSNKKICSTENGEVCYTKETESCSDPAKVRCANLEVDHYTIYRFTSPEAASHWGVDTDGDMWPDAVEDENGYDKCLDTDPAMTPPEHVATIDQTDINHQRPLGETHTQMFFVDQGIPADDIVRWYRVVAVDSLGNQSSLSPPIRAVLHDRQQPKVVAGIRTEVCEYSASHAQDCTVNPNADDTLILIDGTTKDAAGYGLYQLCADEKTGTAFSRELLSGPMPSDLLRVTEGMLGVNCSLNTSPPPSCGAGMRSTYFVRFFDETQSLLAETAPFAMESFCYANGCATLSKQCRWTQPGPGFIPGGPIEVCVDLQAGESARIYHENSQGMSPFLTIEPVTAVGTYCEDVSGLPGIVAADLCLGVRVFSDNHVGSGIHYLNCLELPALSSDPPEAPLMEAVDPKESETKTPQFMVRWAAEGEGLSAFLIEWSNGTDVRYETTWDITPNTLGQFEHTFDLVSADLNREWCFRVKAVDSAMQTSDWALQKCGTWELAPPDVLPWPPVAEPSEGDSVSAFYQVEGGTTTYGLPAIVLSDDLTRQLTNLGNCTETVPVCQNESKGIDCLRLDDTQVFYRRSCMSICELLNSSAKLKNFIMYRQEDGHDFVQVSPLLENFYCQVNSKDNFAVIDDPFIMLRSFLPAAIKGVPDTSIAEGIRLIVQDRYPHIPGAKVRYKILEMNPDTGEIDTVHTTNWVLIP